jgi:phosphoribosylpyrophosphate synthetase
MLTRQDRIASREPISAKLVADLIRLPGIIDHDEAA